MQSRRLRMFGIIGAGVLLALGVSWFIWIRPGKNSQWIPPRIGPVVEAVYGLGTVVAPRTYQVRSAVNQSVQKIFVKEGDQVQKGDRLIQFEELSVFRAPFSGSITSIPLTEGELLFPSTSAVTLVDLAQLDLEVSLEQQTVMRVKKNQKAVVSFESIRGEKLNGKVQSIFPRDAQFIVKIFLDHFPEGVLPGMTADVAIEIGRKENALTLPLQAISQGKVTLKRDGKTLKEGVRLGVVDSEWAEVISDNIHPQDLILVRKK